VGMFGFGYALVPLYDVFCDLTGINGKTDTVASSEVKYKVDKNREVTVEFITSLNESAPMLFKSEAKKMRVHPGEYYTVNFYAENKTDKILLAQAIPSCIERVTEAAEDGFFFMKIKIGQPGTQEEMLEKDKERLSAIHKAIGHRETKHTKNGKLPYYFDANGRYETKDTLLRLLDHAKKIGAFDQIAVIEEPFPEALEQHVGDIGARIAADESAHTDEDALKRIEMGYGAIALKAIAKTLSMTIKIAQLAHEHNVPCFCADLTVNPILVDWNKNVAARLGAFPELGMGLLETNGHQNYKRFR